MASSSGPALNARIYATVNNGVYKAGFATTQDANEEAVRPLFATLDWLEERLAKSRYLCGERSRRPIGAPFTTLVRFDPVYAGTFKCNLRRLVDYPNLWDYKPANCSSIPVSPRPSILPTSSGTIIRATNRINPDRHRPGRAKLDFLSPHTREFCPLGARNRSAECPFDRHHPEKTDERTDTEGNHRAL